MSERGATAALKDILEAIDRIQRYVSGLSESEFLDHTEKQDAVLRNLEVIGEAVRSIPSARQMPANDVVSDRQEVTMRAYRALDLRLFANAPDPLVGTRRRVA